MAKYQIVLSVNSGVSLLIGETKILIDALHTKRISFFSTITPARWQELQDDPRFQKPDALVFTHCHPDHFSQELVGEAKKMWQGAKLILPEQRFPNQLLVNGDEFHTDVKDVHLHFFALPHDRGIPTNIAHYGLILTVNGRNILIAGDCEAASPYLLNRVAGRKIDLALLNFPWITLRRGREALKQIRPTNLLAYHLPLPEDDIYGYGAAAVRAIEKLDFVEKVEVLADFLQETVIEM